MLQIDYDKEMQRLNEAYAAETEGLRLQEQRLDNKNLQLRSEILNLQLARADVCNQLNAIRSDIRSIKVKYASMKHALYLERPAREEKD